MERYVSNFKFYIAALSGLAVGGVYSFGLPALFLPVLLLPFLLLFTMPEKTLNLRQSLKLSVLFFFSYYFVVLIWFLDTDVTLLAGLDPQYAKTFLGLCALIMSMVLTLASLPFGLVIHRLQTRLKKPDLWALLVLASAWVVVEWARSLAFSIFLYATSGSIGDYWNFGSLGLGLISTPLGYLSRLIGIYGLSMLVVCIALTLLWALKKHYKPLLAVLVASTLASYLSYFVLTPGSALPPVAASVLQREGLLTDISENTGIINKQDTPKDVIVLTEYSAAHLPGNEQFVDKYVNKRLGEDGVNIDVTADFTKTDVRYGILEARDHKNELIDAQTKQLLIPTGEYLPGILQVFFKLSGQNSINTSFDTTRRLYRGDAPRVIRTKSLTIAPVACSGILGRNIYRQLVNDGGQVLTNSASLVIFSGSRAYFRQSLQMARFHAVANHRTYIQASMGASAFVIDGDGKYIVAPEDTKTAFIDFEFTPESNKTFYTKLGEWPLLVSAFIVGTFTLIVVTQNRKKHLKSNLKT
ncbi:hypothetical protein H0X10_00960 [Candidatus Saccharibacteria bacterium]|nr:hypothetical protein [Candidatus Saccharibacteria bacterium]